MGKPQKARELNSRNNSLDSGTSLGDLNMKLKLEIGALRGENEGLQKKNEEVARQVVDLENELQANQAKVSALTEEAAKLKRQLESSQEAAKKQSAAESEVKVENAQLKSEYVAATDKIQKLQNEIHRIEAEKKDNLNKIQNMHA